MRRPFPLNPRPSHEKGGLSRRTRRVAQALSGLGLLLATFVGAGVLPAGATSPTTTTIDTLSNPTYFVGGIAKNTAGDLFYDVRDTGDVFVIPAPSDTVIFGHAVTPGVANLLFNAGVNAAGMAFDSFGELFIATDAISGKVSVIAPSFRIIYGTVVLQNVLTQIAGLSGGILSLPNGIAFNSLNDIIVSEDSGVVIDPAADGANMYGVLHNGGSPTLITGAVAVQGGGLVTDNADNIYFDTTTSVQKITTSGTISTVSGTSGLGLQGLARDLFGNIFYLDAGTAGLDVVPGAGVTSILGITVTPGVLTSLFTGLTRAFALYSDVTGSIYLGENGLLVKLGNAPPVTPPATTSNIATTAVQLGASPNPAIVGSPVTFSTAVLGALPTGTMSFFVDGSLLGTAKLDTSGHASLTTNLLSLGAHVITATYPGDANNYGSWTTLTETITPVIAPQPVYAPLRPVLSVVGTRGTLSTNAIKVTLRCENASCGGDAALSVARHDSDSSYKHPATANTRVSLAAGQSTEVTFPLTDFGKSLLSSVSARFHVTLLINTDGGDRIVAPIFLSHAAS
jgi:hypothetical protein